MSVDFFIIVLAFLVLILGLIFFVKRFNQMLVKEFAFFTVVSSLMIITALIVVSKSGLFSNGFVNFAALMFYVLAIFTPISFMEFFQSCRELITQNNRNQKLYALGYVVLIVNLLSFIYLSNGKSNQSDLSSIVETIMTYLNYIVILFIFPSITFYFLFKTTFHLIKEPHFKVPKRLLVNDLVAFMLLLSSFLTNLLLNQFYTKNLFYFLVMYFLGSVLYSVYKLNQKNVESNFNSNQEINDEDYSYFDQIEQRLLPTIQKEKLYLNTKLTLKECAKSIGTNEKYLSNYLNKNHKVNFNTFINNYRIEAAKKMLLSDDSDKYTIEAIAQMSGFNSKSSFNSVFKKYTGSTPSEFKNENKI